VLRTEKERADAAIGREETADEAAAKAQRDRDQHAAVLAEVLATFVHKADGVLPSLRSGPVDMQTLKKWRSVVAPTVERPWWEQVAEAQAAIERVRALAEGEYYGITGRAFLAALGGPAETEGQLPATRHVPPFSPSTFTT
jgi:hypothetical protein